MKILSMVLVILFLATNAFALTVIYNSDTKEILTVGSYDDTAVPNGYEKTELPGKIADWEFIENPTNMKYIDGKFIVNTDKINKEYQAKIIREERTEEEALIQKEMRKGIIDKLKSEGRLKHITE